MKTQMMDSHYKCEINFPVHFSPFWKCSDDFWLKFCVLTFNRSLSSDRVNYVIIILHMCSELHLKQLLNDHEYDGLSFHMKRYISNAVRQSRIEYNIDLSLDYKFCTMRDLKIVLYLCCAMPPLLNKVGKNSRSIRRLLDFGVSKIVPYYL